MLNDDKRLLKTMAAWSSDSHTLALAFTLRTWGSAPRPVGSMLAISDNGKFEGSVSGGCVENSVIEESKEVISTGDPKRLTYGVTDDTAWSLGLPCGGTIELLLIRLNDQAFAQNLLQQSPTTLYIQLSTGKMAIGHSGHWSGELAQDTGFSQISEKLIDSAHVDAQVNEELDVFVRPFADPWRLLIVGAVHIAQPLSAMASLAGFQVTIIDPRSAYLTPDRFPELPLVNDWPDVALAELKPDERTAVVVLSHDHKIDDPALEAALLSPAFYIGALGSRRNHNRRVERLLQNDVTDDQVKRIHAPIGLDIGGSSAGEIAVSVVAQLIGIRNQRFSGGTAD